MKLIVLDKAPPRQPVDGQPIVQMWLETCEGGRVSLMARRVNCHTSAAYYTLLAFNADGTVVSPGFISGALGFDLGSDGQLRIKSND